MKPSNNKISGAVRLLMLFGLLIVGTPLVANAQTKDLDNESNPSAAEIVDHSESAALIDPSAGFQPFQATVNIVQPAGTTASQVDFVTVPIGKRLVIEFVTVIAQVPSGQRATSFILTPAGGGSFTLLINEQPAAINGDAIFRAAQSLRLYANPGTFVRTSLNRSGPQGLGQYQVAISGYLEDVN